MEKIIKYGFLPVNAPKVMGNIVKKGKSLFESKHVHNVIETQHPGEDVSVIKGCVVPQMNVSKPPYETIIKVDCNRNVVSTMCSCKAGVVGNCKHVQALIFYVNSDKSSASKTDFECQWGKPSQLQVYKKGSRIEDIFPQPKLPDCDAAVPLDLSTLNLENIPSALKMTMDMMSRPEEDLVALDVVSNLVDRVVEMEEQSDAHFCMLDIFQLEHCRQQLLSNSNATVPQQFENFFKTEIELSESKILDIAKKTLCQSQCTEWHNVRKKRISSTKCHVIMTRKTQFVKLAETLINLKTVDCPETRYGLQMEENALLEVKKLLPANVKVIKLGVVVKLSEPWLCCSPDAVLDNGTTKFILEIKSPFTCRNKPVFDVQKKEINVSYLYADETTNSLRLKEDHEYYTQIQFQMHVCNFDCACLHVYSSCGSATVMVRRCDTFLANNLKKVRDFYFNYYLPKLVTIV